MTATLVLLALSGAPVRAARTPALVRFAVIGDYGIAGPAEQSVAALVAGWDPDFVITAGDNNYPLGAAETIDDNIGQFYHPFIFPYTGGYGQGSTYNRFFPAPGNHDWYTPGMKAYLDYFSLPGNERYYDFRAGPVHFFALDSDPSEPDGVNADSVQAHWLKSALADEPGCWNLVYFHHPPYSSSAHGSTVYMQWPFANWGVTAVLSGHDHVYERIQWDGMLYFVDGLGGNSTYGFGTPVPGSIVRYNANWGALLVTAGEDKIHYAFYAVDGTLIDDVTQVNCAAQPVIGSAVWLPLFADNR
jgi:tartrate-resistant acid phosphatase type 5